MLTITIDNLDRLSAEDRRDLAELLREVVCTDQPEHRQAAVDAIEEMMFGDMTLEQRVDRMLRAINAIPPYQPDRIELLPASEKDI